MDLTQTTTLMRIEKELTDIKVVLQRQEQLLQDLLEAIHQLTGLKAR
ncbi:MAG: hypothetical protein HY651_04235 [Acidobacteria bacterium]|nr:hypothetical protein [Acidobacteriota bacterium]